MPTSWDQVLPGLRLDHVRIHASSLTEAWKTLSTEHAARSVLVATNQENEHRPFQYESTSCTFRDIYQALASRYQLTLTQDGETGITWFHPDWQPYLGILRSKIDVPHDQWGLPMQSGILMALENDGIAEIRIKQWGTLFLNTFNYAVDVPSGDYTVRELLNLCCLANPTKTFLVHSQDGKFFITAVNLVSDERRSVPPGALLLWDVEVGGQRGPAGPEEEQIVIALATPAMQVRQAARNYLESQIWTVNVEQWWSRGFSAEQILWSCVGLMSILVRLEDATHSPSVETMKRLATPEFLMQGEAGLAVTVALDLARLAKDLTALRIVESRKLTSTDLAGIVSDACRIAALSTDVREVLKTKAAEVLLQALPLLAHIIHEDSSGQVRLKFKVVD